MSSLNNILQAKHTTNAAISAIGQTALDSAYVRATNKEVEKSSFPRKRCNITVWEQEATVAEELKHAATVALTGRYG